MLLIKVVTGLLLVPLVALILYFLTREDQFNEILYDMVRFFAICMGFYIFFFSPLITILHILKVSAHFYYIFAILTVIILIGYPVLFGLIFPDISYATFLMFGFVVKHADSPMFWVTELVLAIRSLIVIATATWVWMSLSEYFAGRLTTT